MKRALTFHPDKACTLSVSADIMHLSSKYRLNIPHVLYLLERTIEEPFQGKFAHPGDFLYRSTAENEAATLAVHGD